MEEQEQASTYVAHIEGCLMQHSQILYETNVYSCYTSRLMTSLIRRNVMLKRVSVVIQAGRSEFKLAYRAFPTPFSQKGYEILTYPE
jgi:hypothetical protein